MRRENSFIDQSACCKMVPLMHRLKYTFILLLGCFIFMADGVIAQKEKNKGVVQSNLYSCIPCGNDCDHIVYSKPGKCPHCQMPLVMQSSITFKTIQPSEVCKYVEAHPKVILLDVRTKEEFEGGANPDYGTLKNAINIPIQQLEARIAELNNMKKSQIIVYCSHSHRSPQASYLLTQHGFTDIINMAGGMSVFKDNVCKK